MTNDYTWKELAEMLMAETHPQSNYHGTPYTFNKFNDANFLTGEGVMAHGPGHYSADFFDTAKQYKHPSVDIFKGDTKVQDYVGHLRSFLERVQPHIDDIEYLEHEKESLLRRLENAKRSDVHMKKYKGIPTEGERLKLQLDALDNLDKYRVQYNQGNVYRVNVPNENFMWKENVPLNQQNNHIQNLWQRRNIDFAKMLSPYGTQLEHDLEGLGLRNINKILGPMYNQLEYRNGLNDVTKRLFNRYMNELPLERQLEFLERSNNLKYLPEVAGDIKGIRAIGMSDGPINVTFSGNNIRMANTPWQRVVNRIPTQTIGMIGRKLMDVPGVRPSLNFMQRATIPLMIYQGLSQPTARDEDYFLKGGIEYNDYQY